MLTRKHISALVRMPDLKPQVAWFSYPDFEIEISDYTLKSPFAEKLTLRFGQQMEVAFAKAIERMEHWNIITQNIQCIQNKTTKGEVDFILQNTESKQFYHVELAVKFYLYVPYSENEIECFIGPNKKDLLHEKLHKMNDRQFPILFEPEVTALLKLLNIDAKHVKQSSCFKAFIFTPFGSEMHHFSEINNACVAGQYLNLHTLDSLISHESKAYVPEKLDWIVNPEHHKNWINWPEAKEAILQQLEKKNAPMVWIKNQESVHRYFVVWWL